MLGKKKKVAPLKRTEKKEEPYSSVKIAVAVELEVISEKKEQKDVAPGKEEILPKTLLLCRPWYEV